jgi:methyl-accepting chemotaxis protein
VESVTRIAGGDLTVPLQVRGDDDRSVLAAMQQMQERLAATLGDIRGAAGAIASATHQISAGNNDLSQRTEQQAAALEQTASSMEELTGIVRQNADNARQASALAVNASEIAKRGGEVVSEVVSTMGEINQASRKIVDIIGVIDGIAFQTNILALNAAVEARAGEQGRGFAVVAGEVRSSQRSANAAKEIKTLIDNSVAQVDTGSRWWPRPAPPCRRWLARSTRDRHHGRDQRRVGRAEHRHRAGGPGRDADGLRHAAERRAGGRSGRCRGRWPSRQSMMRAVSAFRLATV